MPLDPTAMRTDFENVLDEQGTTCTFTKHLIIYSGLYNEALYQTGSNTTTSGVALFLPIGPSDIQILPQGQVSLYPRKMFVHGSIDVTSDSVVLDVNGSAYSIISNMGITDYTISGTIIYRKAFVRAQIGSEGAYNG